MAPFPVHHRACSMGFLMLIAQAHAQVSIEMPKSSMAHRRPSTSKALSPASLRVADVINANAVVIFSQSCEASARTKGYFEDLGVPYLALEVDARADSVELKRALAEVTGSKTVPSVFVHGQHVGGSTETGRAYRTGELEHWISSDFTGAT
uniref:Glutaredoxin domain-containing protein n=1 Tax=Haptolina ericina TaxID=156174 RepID=A0A7S3F1Y4_9EUKA|mmetsp:Transcript_46811/g.105555  ORF Transcript_46811/g.105555 Transcript_46811/m.105555 type:complete len:151 (+) Transcript_46811:84-536(+)